jgi:Fuseless
MKWTNVLLTGADIILIVFIVFPLSILHWRGTWQLQDVYFFPADKEKSLWTSFAVGANVCVIELLIQPYLNEKLSTSGRCIYVFVSRLHLYIHGWAVMCYWRGLWDLLDIYLTTSWINAVVMYSACQLILVITRTVRTAVGIPVSLRLDTSSDLLEADLVFKTSVWLQHNLYFISFRMEVIR